MEKPEPACQAAAHGIGRRPQRERERERIHLSTRRQPVPNAEGARQRDAQRRPPRTLFRKKKSHRDDTARSKPLLCARDPIQTLFLGIRAPNPAAGNFSDSQSQRALFAAYVRATLSQSETTST
jgi:hypothetical protein